MNINNILSEMEKVDADVYDRLDTRRKALSNFANVGGKIALSALPLALGSMFKKAYAGTRSTQDLIGILNYALTLEYLEAEFYAESMKANGLYDFDATLKNGIITIAGHEAAHVNFLKTTIEAAGGTAVAKPTFDFSAGGGSGNGPFKGVFGDITLFLAVSQTFEDTGVRAYKGRAAELVGGGVYTTAALQIHSVEARHAAFIRKVRKDLGSGVGTLKPWITGNMSGINSTAVQPSYDGEEVTTQAGVDITAFVSAEAASESFDEPLTPEQVLAIVGGFIVS